MTALMIKGISLAPRREQGAVRKRAIAGHAAGSPHHRHHASQPPPPPDGDSTAGDDHTRTHTGHSGTRPQDLSNPPRPLDGSTLAVNFRVVVLRVANVSTVL